VRLIGCSVFEKKEEKSQRMISASEEFLNSFGGVRAMLLSGVLPSAGEAAAFNAGVKALLTALAEWVASDRARIRYEMTVTLRSVVEGRRAQSASDPALFHLRSEALDRIERQRFYIMREFDWETLQEIDRECGLPPLSQPQEREEKPISEMTSPEGRQRVQLAHDLMLFGASPVEPRAGEKQHRYARERLQVAPMEDIAAETCGTPPRFEGFVHFVERVVTELAVSFRTWDLAEVQTARAEIADGSFDWDACVYLLTALVASMHARIPVPDGEWGEWGQITVRLGHAVDRAGVLAEAMWFTVRCAIRLATEALNTSRALCLMSLPREHGVFYEHKYMQARIRKGLVPKRSMDWISFAVGAELKAGRLTTEALLDGARATVGAVVRAGIFGLVWATNAPTMETFPETLDLDLARLQTWWAALRGEGGSEEAWRVALDADELPGEDALSVEDAAGALRVLLPCSGELGDDLLRHVCEARKVARLNVLVHEAFYKELIAAAGVSQALELGV
jgi:hypothetical protein